ncbi:unnamed protein product [Closterium sp. NIES-53]
MMSIRLSLIKLSAAAVITTIIIIITITITITITIVIIAVAVAISTPAPSPSPSPSLSPSPSPTATPYRAQHFPFYTVTTCMGSITVIAHLCKRFKNPAHPCGTAWHESELQHD